MLPVRHSLIHGCHCFSGPLAAGEECDAKAEAIAVKGARTASSVSL
jgi:hypothetical protein